MKQKKGGICMVNEEKESPDVKISKEGINEYIKIRGVYIIVP